MNEAVAVEVGLLVRAKKSVFSRKEGRKSRFESFSGCRDRVNMI
jgi:hypothetical protein